MSPSVVHARLKTEGCLLVNHLERWLRIAGFCIGLWLAYINNIQMCFPVGPDISLFSQKSARLSPTQRHSEWVGWGWGGLLLPG